MKRKVLSMKTQFKKRLAAFMVFVFLLSLTGCGDGDAKAPGVSLNEDFNIPLGSLTEASTEQSTTEAEKEYEYAEGENEEFQKFIKEYFENSVTVDSTYFNSYVQNGEHFGIERPEATLGDSDMSEEAIEKSKKKDEEFYNKLIAFEDQPLNEDERFTYRCLKEDTEINMRRYDYIYLTDPFSPGNGNQENLPSVFTDYRFNDKRDVDDYVELMKQSRAYFKGLIDFEYTKSEKGTFMSDAAADKVIEQCDTFMKDKENHFVLDAFNTRVEKLDFLTEDEVKEYKEKVKEAFENYLLPAYQDLKDAMQELKGTGKNDKGVCYFENGKDYYAKYLFPKRSGSSKTVEEEIQYMDDRMNKLLVDLASIYYSNQEAFTEYENRRVDQTIYKAYDDMSAEEVIDMLQKDYMDDFPMATASIPYEFDMMGEKRGKISDSTLAYYELSPVDAPEQNHICLNDTKKGGLVLTLAHEGCPGHMLQTYYFRNTNPNLARSISFNLGYIEGWAVYSSYSVTEKLDFLGKEEYGDVFGKIDRIYTDMLYLVEGRVDIGINYEGWGEEEIKNYLQKNGLSVEDVSEFMVSHAADPGIMLSYTTGYFEMLELREKAESELGDKFDVKDYHKAILDVGPCQYKFLSEKVDEYIEKNK